MLLTLGDTGESRGNLCEEHKQLGIKLFETFINTFIMSYYAFRLSSVYGLGIAYIGLMDIFVKQSSRPYKQIHSSGSGERRGTNEVERDVLVY